MASVPQVCKRWRTLCQDIRKVHLDLVGGGATFLLKCSPGGGRRPSCPMVVMLATAAAAAAATAIAAAALEVKGQVPWNHERQLDSCTNLTDAAVIALANKRRGIMHATFKYCDNLTDASVVALADKCPGITHADFRCCENLTGFESKSS
eukprot:gene25316-biopygen25507